MRIDKMNKRITIYKEDYVDDGQGGREEGERQEVCKCWAQLLVNGGVTGTALGRIGSHRTSFSMDANVNSNELTIYIRRNNKIKRGMIMCLDGEEYNITYVGTIRRDITIINASNLEVGD